MALRSIRMLCSAISHMPLHFVFRESGVTRKHGFELEIDIARVDGDNKPVRSMEDRAKLLLDGDYEFLSGLHHEPYQYRARKDSRFVYLAQPQNYWDDRLISRPDIDRPAQLEGKRIMTRQAACVGGVLTQALKRVGVDTSKVEFVFPRKLKGRDSLAVDLVERGEIEAAVVDIPFDLRARKRGLNVIELPSEPVIHNTTICASTEFVYRNEETVESFLKALIEAIHFFKSEKQKVREILERRMAPLIGLQSDEEVDYLREQWSGLLSAKPYPHPLAIWNVYDLDVAHDPEVNFIGPLEIWDTHYLRRIDDSGFIDGLYGRA